MQKHKTGAWSLLIIVLGLDGVAYWAMVWRRRLFFWLVKLQRHWPLVPRISFD